MWMYDRYEGGLRFVESSFFRVCMAFITHADCSVLSIERHNKTRHIMTVDIEVMVSGLTQRSFFFFQKSLIRFRSL